MRIRVSEVKPGMEFRFHGWLIRVTKVEVRPALYDKWKEHHEKKHQYDMIFDILSEGLFNEKIGWSFWHFYSDEVIDTDTIPDEDEETDDYED